jgi:hypothetical protein
LKKRLQASLLTHLLTHEKLAATRLFENVICDKVLCMGFQETQHVQMDMYSRSAIVALSVQPPGVNELFVCLFVQVWAHEIGFLSLYEAWATNLESLLLQSQ